MDPVFPFLVPALVRLFRSLLSPELLGRCMASHPPSALQGKSSAQVWVFSPSIEEDQRTDHRYYRSIDV